MANKSSDTYGFKAPASLQSCAEQLQPIVEVAFELRSSSYRGNYCRAAKAPAEFILQNNFVDGEGLTLPGYNDYAVLFLASNMDDPEPLRKSLAELKPPADLLWRISRSDDGTIERFELKDGILTSVRTYRAPRLQS